MNPFEDFQTDTIRIVSKNGNVSENLKSHVTPNLISLYTIDIPVTEGDFIDRDLPNNRTERYEILEANFHKEFHVIPAHYQLKVRKTTVINPTSTTNTVYNIHGNHSRVYNNSLDQSTNVVNDANKELFQDLKKKVIEEINDNGSLLIQINDLEKSVGQTSYTKNYMSFIANAANHMTVISPFIPALTSFLHSM